MNKGLIIGLGVLGAFIGIILFFIVGYANIVATGNRHERGIEAQWTDNQNVLSGYTMKVKEAAQIPQMQTNALKEVMQAAFEGRYGENGSQAVFQWIKEAYPGQVDNELYRKLQTIIEAGRTEFTTAQRQLIDKKRAYDTDLNYAFKGALLRMIGYPKIDLKKFNVVISAQTTETFRTGEDSVIQLAPSPNAATEKAAPVAPTPPTK